MAAEKSSSTVMFGVGCMSLGHPLLYLCFLVWIQIRAYLNGSYVRQNQSNLIKLAQSLNLTKFFFTLT